MKHTIYAFRLFGEDECRYVGMTTKGAAMRLCQLTRDAEHRRDRRHLLDPDAFQLWLLENKGSIEALSILIVGTKAEAHVAERAVVAAMLATGHRLFNSWLVPKALRLNFGAPAREAA